ncbi:MAG: DUF192 domain-containing protein [Gaiellales bacterium]
MKTIELADAATGLTVCGRCEVADKPWVRLRGLLGRDLLEPEQGMLFSHTSSVHTYGMKFPIDVVFLDQGLTVLSAHAHVSKGRAVKHKGASWTLELPAGTVHRRQVTVGMHLVRRDASQEAEPEQPSDWVERRSPTSVGARLRRESARPSRRRENLL